VTEGVAPPIFVVGCPRSGTTLLRLMLDAHRELAIPPESHFISLVARVRGRYEQPSGFDADHMATDVMRGLRFRDWHLPEDAVRTAIRERHPTTLAAAIECFFVAYADAHRKSRWGDKTPGYSIELPLISELFPEAVFVHLIRDGRNVAMSLMEVPRPPRSIAEAAQVWRSRVARGRTDGAALGSERYLELRYESLVDDPESALKQICALASLGYTPAMLDYHREDPAASVPERNWGHHQHLARPPTKGLRDWRDRMTGADQQLFEAVAGDELEGLGYERRFPRVSAGVRARATAILAYDRARHAARAARLTLAMARHPEALPPPRRW
jgi:sulfotransferase family protein